MRAVHFNQSVWRPRVLLLGAAILAILLGVILLLALLAQTPTLASEAGTARSASAVQARPPAVSLARALRLTERNEPGVITSAVVGGLAYVTLADSDRVGLIDTASHFVGVVNVGAAGCDYPWRAAITPDGKYVCVSCLYSGNLAVIATASNTVAGTVEGTLGADGIAFTRDGAYALVGSNSGNRFMVVDMASGFLSYKSTPGPTRGVAAHPYLDRAYAACGGGSILVIDTKTFGIVQRIPVGGEPWDVALSADGQWLFASDRQGGGLAVIDIQSNTVQTWVTGLGSLGGLDVAPDGSAVYASGFSSGVHVIDGTTFSRTATIASVGDVSEVAVTCDGRELYVGNGGSQVPVIDTETRAVADRVEMPGSGTQGIAICPPRVARGVLLAPGVQTRSAGRGQVVAYQERVVNASGAADSFSLTLSSHAWGAALSTDVVGPIASGEVMTFTLYVPVPIDVNWYATSTVSVTAASLTKPGEYADTATFTTRAYAPPQLTVSPAALTSTQYMNSVVTRPLSITNGNGVTLTFDTVSSGVTDAVLLMHLDEPAGATTFHDDSGNNHHGSCSGASCPKAGVDGRFSKALRFDGSNDHVIVGSPVPQELQIQDEISLEAWIYATEYPAYDTMGTIVGCQYDPTSSGYAIHLDGRTSPDGQPSPPGHIHFQIGNGNWHVANVNAQVPLNQWVHIVATRRAGESGRVYYNGVPQPSTSVPWDGSITYSGAELDLGRQSDLNRFFKGVIDEVAIYDRALSAEEVQVHYLTGTRGKDVPWLTRDPISGTVPSNATSQVQVTFDATGLQPDTYTTTLAIQSNDSIKPLTSVPVTMTVLPTANMGWVEGRVTDAWTGVPLTATVIAVGQPYTITTAADGTYKLWLDAGSRILQVAAERYVTQTVQVDVIPQQGIMQDLALVPDVPRIKVSPPDITVTQSVGSVTTRTLTIANNGPAPLNYRISTDALSFFAVSTELYGYIVASSGPSMLRVIGTQDHTCVRVINLVNGVSIAENADLDRYETWDVYPSSDTYYKVAADKPVLGYESNWSDCCGHTAFVPSLASGPVGTEFIFYYYRCYIAGCAVYVFALEDATIEVYNTSGSLVGERALHTGEYWDLMLPNAVYHVISTGRVAIETVGENSYTTVPGAEGFGTGRLFYFATHHSSTGAFAVFAYQDADVRVHDLDTGGLLYSQHIDRGNYWFETGADDRRLRVESTGSVEVWAGSTEGGSNIQDLGDDISFAGGRGSREYYVHSLIDGFVVFAPVADTTVSVDGTTYRLQRDGYLHLSGCCYLRHILSNQPILILTLGGDSAWNDVGTYLGGAAHVSGSALPWVGIDPVTGTVPAYSSMSVQLTFSAPGLQPGDYSTSISISSNDPKTPSLSVTATMVVEPLRLFLPLIQQGKTNGLIWHQASDFRYWPNQENPNRDSYGNLGVWRFMSADRNRQPHTELLQFGPQSGGMSALQSLK